MTTADRAAQHRLGLERARFLAEASRLLAQSLDYEATLETVAKLATPELGAWALVDLVEDDGAIRRLAVVHPDPSKQALARELERGYPPAVQDALGAPLVLRTREAELVPEVTDALLVAVARDPRHLEILRSLGIGSLMVVPMLARGHVVGCMTFVSADSERRYAADDLALADDLATRCALAVDNARLYRAAQQARAESLAARRDAERGRGVAETAQAVADQARGEAVEFGLRAQDSERVKSDFLSTMSHELRTPINAVLGYADLLLAGVDGTLGERQREYLERQQAASRHLLALVNDVLDVAKADANRLLLTREVADAREAARGAITMVQPQAAARRVSLAVDAGGRGGASGNGHAHGRIAYLGDPRRTEQVLINLLSNAVKFTPAGGSVHVEFERWVGALGGPAGRTCEPAGGRDAAALPAWVLVRVRDTGIGIPPDAQERVFEPFVQLEPGHTRAAGGSGLGLAISRRIARLMDGDVTVESTPGAGSTFTLWLRAVPSGAGDATAGVSPGAALPGDRRGPERLTRGLYEVGDALLRAIDGVVVGYSERVRVDPAIPAADEAPWTELANHTATLLTDVAQALGVVEEAAGGPALLMRVGEEIRAVISERHGQRRAQLGWTLEGLERDADILDEEVAVGVQRALPADPAFPVAEGLEIMRKLLARSRVIAREGFLRENGLALPADPTGGPA
jgi:signal transduction histidine kinase